MGINPKRRKSKDNPYTLNYLEEKNIYIVSFKDVKGTIQDIEVSKDIYNAFGEFELKDLSQLNEYDRHIEHSEVYENKLDMRILDKPELLEDSVIRKSTYEDLMKAINTLPDVQKRRIKKYYFDEKNLQEIATEEHCSKVAVKYSIDNAITKLKEILKN